jgi:alpha-tubulin suppressor-like RCC1 family protein
MTTNVLFIDNTVPDADIFESSVNAFTFPIRYSSASTKDEILTLLKTNFSTINRIGVVSITSLDEPNIFLDTNPFFVINEPQVSPYSVNVEFILSVIREFNVKNIDFLACDTLNYPNWVNYYSILTKETNVIVGASNNKTGNIQYGGDWLMESTSQDIEQIYFTQSIEYYTYLLDPHGFSTILIQNSLIWVAGNNSYGQLGDGTTVQKSTLINMTNTTGRIPKYVSCGEFTTIVMMSDNTIWGTGYNFYGQIGNGGNTTRNRLLTQMLNTTGFIPKWISCGFYNTIVMMTNGTIWGTGNNSNGQLGIASGNITTTNLTLVKMDTSTGVIGSRTPTQITAGGASSYVLMTDNTIWGTGNNTLGQLGIASGNTTSTTLLTQMDTSSGVIGSRTPTQMSGGKTSFVLLMTDNTIWGTGDNSFGQLGIASGNTTDTTVLTQMNTSSGVIGSRTPKQISSGQSFTIVLMTDNTIWGTGDNSYGQLGIAAGNTTDTTVLTQMDTSPGVIGSRIPAYISTADFNSYVLFTDGSVWGSGDNSSGQLAADPNITNQSELLVSILPGNLSSYNYVMGMTAFVDASCFNEGTKILCLNKSLEEEYIPIEHLKKGDLVKSYKHGYRRIDLIGKNTMFNNPKYFNLCMYKMIKTEENGLLEDLIVTGGHALLVDDLTTYVDKNKKLFKGETIKIDDKYLLLAAVSDDFIKIENNDLYIYYHLTLENNGDNNERFGIWANGVLTETPSNVQFLNAKYTLL